MPFAVQRERRANRLLRVMALSAELWNESWNDSVNAACNQRTASTKPRYQCRQSAWALGRAYGKEKVYGSIP
jgi:hypothetical protein